jgi:hypothetical protein
MEEENATQISVHPRLKSESEEGKKVEAKKRDRGGAFQKG